MWPNPHFPSDFVTFTEKIRNGKLHFLCSNGYLACSCILIYLTPEFYEMFFFNVWKSGFKVNWNLSVTHQKSFEFLGGIFVEVLELQKPCLTSLVLQRLCEDICRRSCSEVLYKNDILKNFPINLRENACVGVSFLIKLLAKALHSFRELPSFFNNGCFIEDSGRLLLYSEKNFNVALGPGINRLILVYDNRKLFKRQRHKMGTHSQTIRR